MVVGRRGDRCCEGGRVDGWVSCEAGTYIRTMYVHVGLLLGVGGHMQVRGWFGRVMRMLFE